MLLLFLLFVLLIHPFCIGRWNSFPDPDFRSVIQISSQNGASSYREISHSLGVLPWLVRVYAQPSVGSNAGFAFEGLGSAQSDDDNSFYGGIIFGFNENNVRIWVPSRNDGNSKGRVVWVKDGWGGERNSEESQTASVVIEVWKNGPTAAWKSTVTLTAQSTSYKELRPAIKTLPDYLQVQVKAIDGNNKGYVFYGTGSAQTDDDSNQHGGVIYAYDEDRVRLWTAHGNDGNSIGQCIFVGDGWGGGISSQSSASCEVTVLLWVDDLPSATFTSEWLTMQSQNINDSYKEIQHKLGKIPAKVQVQVRAIDGLNKDFVFEAFGSAMTNDDNNDYGGVVFAYNESMVRLWAPSRNDGTDKGRIIFVGDGWGKENNVQMSTIAMVRVLAWTGCDGRSVAIDGGVCVTVDVVSAHWLYGDYGNCSVICGLGHMTRKESHCVTTKYKTIFSCNFGTTKEDMCGFVSTSFTGLIAGWKVRSGKTVSSDTGPLYDHTDGKSYYVYTETSSVGKGQSASLTSPDLVGANSSCTLSFNWLFFGSDVGVVTAEVQTGGKWSVVWSVRNDQQLVWRPAMVHLEGYAAIEEIRFVHVVGSESSSTKNAYRGDAAIDDVELVCAGLEETNTTDVVRSFCEERQHPLPGCVLSAVQTDETGPAYNSVVDGGTTYVAASGFQSEFIAQYKVNVVKAGVHLLWLRTKAANNNMNGIRVTVNGKVTDWEVRTGLNAEWHPLLSSKYLLSVGIHTVQLSQLDSGFKFSHLAIIPQALDSYAGLGLQTFVVSDSSLSASSTASGCQSFGARLKSYGTDRIGWCSSRPSMADFLQIDLPEMAVVSRIATQGRQDKDEWTREYQVTYSLDGVLFDDFTNDINQVNVLEGNTDKDTVKVNVLAYPIPARSFRIYPKTWNGNKALRVELYGVYVTDGQCTLSGSKNLTTSCNGDATCGPKGYCQSGVNGDCQCHAGFYGTRCSNSYCQPHPCLNNGTCLGLSVGYLCDCLPGFEGKICDAICNATHFGRNCANRCNCSGRGICDRKNGSCTCDTGYTGTHCEKDCPIGRFGSACANVCLCQNGAHCHSVSGECTCSSGYRGVHCETPCNGSTWGVDCLEPCRCKNSARCDGVSGTCHCLPGYTGIDCGHVCTNATYGLGCRSKCKCQNGALCDAVTGDCTCTAAGFTGPFCDQLCSSLVWGVDCVHLCLCKNDGVCDPFDGSCECLRGWTGQMCDQACSATTYGRNCSSTCTCSNGALCDRFTGACQCLTSTGCVCNSGWKDVDCQSSCDQQQWGPGCRHNCTCTDKGICSRFDGFCSCFPGYINTTCNQPCPSGQYGDGCSLNCSCAALTTQYCRNTDGYCHCLPGYRGSDCSQLCDAGFWGQGCVHKCGCKNGAECIAVDGSCVCTPGYQGAHCDIPCLDGYYGPGCTQLCQCQNGKCNIMDGTCTCTPGWQGVYCDSHCGYGYWGPSCSKTCVCNGGSCDSSSGTCSCLAGYTGLQCLQICASGTWGLDCGSTCQRCSHGSGVCHHETGRCPCPAGYQGATCSQACPAGKYGSNCLLDCHCANGTCDAATGICSCNAGYVGQNCTETCPDGTYGKQCSLTCSCVHGICSPIDGSCACHLGYIGIYCDQRCPKGVYGISCLQPCGCVHGSVCNHTNGVCDCDAGWAGPKCDQACPLLTYGKNCQQSCICHNEAQCDPVTGDCLCMDGWLGPSCLRACPFGFHGSNCSASCMCTAGGGCHHVTGRCQCPSGYMGESCDTVCSVGYHGPDCLLQCDCDPTNTLKSTVCDPISGTCHCRPGYTGNCSTVCPSDTFGLNCSYSCLCENGGECHHVSGECTCAHGYLKPFCNQTCSYSTYGMNCLSTCNCTWDKSVGCDHRNGQCLCLPGYNGTQCEQKCVGFFYGPMCGSQCTACSWGHSSGCDGVTGECVCDSGWTGALCDTACSSGFYGPGCHNRCRCENGADCDRLDGSCSCTKGYTGRYCTQECSGFMFGADCSESCDCLWNQTVSCHHINGSCNCMPGFKGNKCQQGCNGGQWGSDCIEVCPICSPHIRGYCHPVDGSCVCLPGYQNYYCTADCPLTLYGHGCSSLCPECPDDYVCNHVHGKCQYIKDALFWIDFAVTYTQAQNDDFQLQLKLALAQAFSLYAPLEIELDDLSISPGLDETNITFVSENHRSSRSLPLQQVMDYNRDYVARIVNVNPPREDQGTPKIKITFIVLYKNWPLKGRKAVTILRPIPEDRLQQFFSVDNIGRPATDGLDDQEEDNVPVTPVVIGSVCGCLVIIILFCLCVWRHRTAKKYAHGPTYLYRPRTNQRPTSLATSSRASSSGQASPPQRATFDNLYYDIMTALELEDDVEHTFENPLYEHEFRERPTEKRRSSLFDVSDVENVRSWGSPGFLTVDQLELRPRSDLPLSQVIRDLRRSRDDLDRPTSSPPHSVTTT